MLCIYSQNIGVVKQKRGLQFNLSDKKTHIALIILIIALQFDVSTSCNEEIKINEVNKNCVLFNIFLFYFRPSKGRCGCIAANCVIMHFRLLWLHSGHVVVYTTI